MINSINKIHERVGKNLREIRQKFGITQTKLGIILDVNSNYISQIERGIRMPSIKKLAMIAEVLRVDISEFFKKD